MSRIIPKNRDPKINEFGPDDFVLNTLTGDLFVKANNKLYKLTSRDQVINISNEDVLNNITVTDITQLKNLGAINTSSVASVATDDNVDYSLYLKPEAIFSKVDDSTYKKFTIAARVGQFVSGNLFFDQNLSGSNNYIALGKTDTADTQFRFSGNITASGNISASSGNILGRRIFLDADLIHSGDEDTKMTFGSDNITFNVGTIPLLALNEDTQNLVTIGNGGDVDFQVKSGETNALFVQGSSGNTGLGLNNPGEKLTVIGNISASGTVTMLTASIGGGTFTSASLAAGGSGGGTTTNALTVDNTTLQLNSGTTFDGSAAKTISIKDGGIDSDALAADITVTSLTSTHITASGNITVDGNIIATGDVVAQRYIVSSSVTHLTQSFSSGSTIFGNTSDDTHTFTGDITASGNISASGTIVAAELQDTSLTAGRFVKVSAGGVLTDDPDFTSTGNDVTFGRDLTLGRNLIIDAGTISNVSTTHITASGNISSSGTIVGSNLSGTNTGDQDLSSYSTITQLNASSSTLQTNIDAKQDTLTFGISNTNIIKAGAGIVDNDFLRVNGTTLEGRSAAQVLNDIGGQVAIGTDDLTIAMTDGLQAALDAKAPIANPSFTGNVTASGNISSSGTITANSLVGPLSTAAQPNITSVGTLTNLVVDNVQINSNAINSTSDTDVFFSIGTAGLGFEANNGDKFEFNSAQNNVDFQYNGENDGTLLYIDASADKVGIGVSTPGEKLTVAGNISASGTIVGSNLSGTNTGDQDLSSYSTIVQLNASSSTLQTNMDAKAPIANPSFTSNVTASGNISASGTVIGSNLTNVENTAISTFAGTTNITTVGTIGTGTWNGNVIQDIYLSSNTAHLTGTQTFSGAKTFSANPILSGTTKLIAADMEAIHYDGQLIISQDNRKSKLRGTSFNVDTDITASGNISASGGTITAGTLTANGAELGTIRLSSTTDASATSTGHAFQVGATNSTNVIMDNNEIMARNNGAVSNLHVNPDGGIITFNNSVSDKVLIGNGNITASANISSSGDIYTNLVFVNQAQSLEISGDDATLFGGHGSNKILLGKGNQTPSIFTNGAITASGAISSSGTITANSLVGPLGTAAQTNITSVGTLGSLTVSGDITANGNIVGDDSTNITNIDNIECDSLIHNGDTDTKITFSTDSIRFTAGNSVVTSFNSVKILNNLPLINKFVVPGTNAGDEGGGDVVYFGGTTSMTTGAIYHYKSDGTWELADATDNTKADGLLGVALGSTSDSNGVLLRGMVTLDHDAGNVGDPIYLTTTAGDASATAPGNSGNVVRHLGYKIYHATEQQIWFNPSNDWIEIA